MIELLMLVQMTTAQPQADHSKRESCGICYKAPNYSSSAPTNYSVPNSKQIEEFEEKIFDHPN